ncbi:MAG TPA: hypothetical protein VFB45_22495 [Pseudolabrys sp.]|nr:hypothetical protein [Pseudolabrys sp.]
MGCRAVFACLAMLAVPAFAMAQSCPEPLASARRLVLVTTDGMNTPKATLQRFERESASEPWHAVGDAEAAAVGRTGIGWSVFFRKWARAGEPIKVEGDKRAPAGIYRLGPSFGLAPAQHAHYRQLTEGTVCVDDASSPAYNTITSRAKVGWSVHGENMWRVPDYRHGLFIDYPTDARARAGSCVFVHILLPGKHSTGGCVALPEARVEALQDFSASGAVIAILPRAALARGKGCLP